MRVVFMRDFDTVEARLEGTRQILQTLVGLAEKKAA
jgi:transcription-repair coupling factor (superfamily II helicase)